MSESRGFGLAELKTEGAVIPDVLKYCDGTWMLMNTHYTDSVYLYPTRFEAYYDLIGSGRIVHIYDKAGYLEETREFN